MRNFLLLNILFLLAFILLGIISLKIGPVKISFSEIINLLKGINKNENIRIIIFEIRLPRLILAFVTGASLSVAGLVFQVILRNPLAEPYILGVSSGGALGAVIALSIGISLVPIFSFLGALITIFLVYKIAQVNGRTSSLSLVLAGIVINAFFSALVMLLTTLLKGSSFKGIIFWLMGSIDCISYDGLLLVIFLVFIGIVFIYTKSYQMNILTLGEEKAGHLGINVERLKKYLFILSSIITGAVVSLSGLIGFVGLIVPHLLRTVVGTDNRKLIIFSVWGGGIFLVSADIISRILLSDRVLPIGVITALFGAPFFIFVFKSKMKSS